MWNHGKPELRKNMKKVTKAFQKWLSVKHKWKTFMYQLP